MGIERFGPTICAVPAPSSAAIAAEIWSKSVLLGHSSIQTTERYLGSEQEIAVAVNDNLGL
jgi:hypothetical protein